MENIGEGKPGMPAFLSTEIVLRPNSLVRYCLRSLPGLDGVVVRLLAPCFTIFNLSSDLGGQHQRS